MYTSKIVQCLLQVLIESFRVPGHEHHPSTLNRPYPEPVRGGQLPHFQLGNVTEMNGPGARRPIDNDQGVLVDPVLPGVGKPGIQANGYSSYYQERCLLEHTKYGYSQGEQYGQVYRDAVLVPVDQFTLLGFLHEPTCGGIIGESPYEYQGAVHFLPSLWA